MALHADDGIKLRVINPRLARRFAELLGTRSKTDPVDARVLCLYAQRMPRVTWQPPSPVSLHLRSITRAVEALTRMLAQEKARQHAAEASAALPRLVVNESKRHQRLSGTAHPAVAARCGADFRHDVILLGASACCRRHQASPTPATCNCWGDWRCCRLRWTHVSG